MTYANVIIIITKGNVMALLQATRRCSHTYDYLHVVPMRHVIQCAWVSLINHLISY